MTDEATKAASDGPVSRDALGRMRSTLAGDRAAFEAQLSRLRQACAETETQLQRTDGALIVVEKLLAGEGPGASIPPTAPPDSSAPVVDIKAAKERRRRK